MRNPFKKNPEVTEINVDGKGLNVKVGSFELICPSGNLHNHSSKLLYNGKEMQHVQRVVIDANVDTVVPKIYISVIPLEEIPEKKEVPVHEPRPAQAV